MKKYILLVLGLILLAGGATYYYFKTSKINLISVERILTKEEQEKLLESYYLDQIVLNVKISQKIKNMENFIIQNEKFDDTFNTPAKLLTENDTIYETKFSNLDFNYVKYNIIGYVTGGESFYFDKPLSIEVNDPYPIKVLEFDKIDMVEINEKDLELNFKLYNPLKFKIIEVKYSLNEDYKSGLSDDIVLENTETNHQKLHLKIPNNLLDNSKIELISIVLEHKGSLYEHIIKEDISEVISVYKEIEVIDFIAPSFIFQESKDFAASLVLKENSDKKIYGFNVKVNDKNFFAEVEEKTIREDQKTYLFYLPNNSNNSVLNLKVTEVIFDDDSAYKIGEINTSIELKRALDGVVLRAKSSTVMSKTRYAFYLECSYIDEKINLTEFVGKFNGLEFEGKNLISSSKSIQEQEEFGYIDARGNIISLITLPVQKMEGFNHCSFEISELKYYYNNQINTLTLNKAVWVIPEEVSISIKSFAMTKDTYDLTQEKPMAQLELLVSNTITIEKIALEVNGQIIETSFKDGGIKGPNGTLLFNCLAYKESLEKEFSVKIYVIEYNGQGTRGQAKQFINNCSYKLK